MVTARRHDCVDADHKPANVIPFVAVRLTAIALSCDLFFAIVMRIRRSSIGA